MFRIWPLLFAGLLQPYCAGLLLASDPASLEYFEAKIRPILVEHCYACHNSSGTSEGDLRLDLRQGWFDGGQSGPAIVVGDAAKSLLLKAIAHESPDLKMPPTGLKLSDEVIDDFRRWIAAGATDPRDKPPTAEQLAESQSWEKTLESRKKWWSFQPLRLPSLPSQSTSNSSSSSSAKALDEQTHPIDQFIQARLEQARLSAAPRAGLDALIRRVYFNLIGLPPTREEHARWKSRLSQAVASDALSPVFGQLVDELLADVRFGERWARHWMDWIRYAESHGSEGDPAIANAWMYRDYLIRSLNEDVPIDQMIREHIAGDLIPPRIHSKLHLNESLIATAHWRMVFHGFSPTDALDERVRFIDDQINTFSKAFLGITVSCARCHDHKFDPISQADYYAMYGILSSCRPGRTSAESDEYLQRNRASLMSLKEQLRSALAKHWISTTPQLKEILATAADRSLSKPADQLSPLEKAFWHPLLMLGQPPQNQTAKPRSVIPPSFRWDLSLSNDAAKWFRVGVGLESPRTRGEIGVVGEGGAVGYGGAVGDVVVALQGDESIKGLHAGGLSTRWISDKDGGRLSSPDFLCPQESVVWIQAEGDGGASLRYVVQNYPRNGTIYPTQNLRPGLQWYKFDVAYWAGDQLHIEITTPRDAPLLTGEQPRSWFRVTQALVLPRGQSPEEEPPPIVRLIRESKHDSNPGQPPETSAAESPSPDSRKQELIRLYTMIIAQAIQSWSSGGASSTQVELLDQAMQLGLLPRRLGHDASVDRIIGEYRELESQLPVSTRVPCLEETVGTDAPLYVRGDHRRPDKLVPRRFLEAIDASPFRTQSSGRLELAEAVLSSDNPLTRRVFANRIWHHLFGAGIVTTTDNLGRLGAMPSHPELLDWLAVRLPEVKWSLKAMIREIMMTDVWQRSSTPSQAAIEQDTDNLLLSHAHLRRYEAEAIRDALLAVAGNIDASSYGPPQSSSGTRRSVYLPVIRNSLNPFLRTFDFPEPFSSVGRRDQTNVPAQSLTLMNDAFVTRRADAWARHVLSSSDQTTEQVTTMIETAFAREAAPTEVIALSKLFQASLDQMTSAANDAAQASRQLDDLNDKLTSLQAHLRQEIVKTRTARQSDATKSSFDGQGIVSHAELTPLVEWRFDDTTANPQVNTAEHRDNTANPLNLIGKSKVENGALIVSSDSYAVSKPLKKDLQEKTLSVVVQLDNLHQRAGGAITVQSADGNNFDSIVFGEQAPGQWLAGSNNFSRTSSFQGPPETEAHKTPIHFAIAYDSDGNIRGYRNGKPYGQAYRSAGLQRYAADQTVVTLGLRHLPAGGNRSLSGRIIRAQVFDRALSEAEISSLAAGVDYVSLEETLAAMSEAELKDWNLWQQQIITTREQLESARSQLPGLSSDITKDVTAMDIHRLALAQVARTIFTLKEFIYVP